MRVSQPAISKATRAIAPSGLVRLWRRRQLRKRHGLVGLGPDFEYQVADNTSFGRACRLGGPVYVSGSTIGDYTYIELGCRISAARIGKFCSIAPYSLIGLPEHPTRRFVSTHPIFYRNIPELGYSLVEEGAHNELEETHVGNDVWIGAGVCVKGGVTIGDGAVIGAGAVVVDDVPPYSVYGGVPARLLRQRFDDDSVSLLLELRWWDQDDEWLADNAVAMQDIDQFLLNYLNGP